MLGKWSENAEKLLPKGEVSWLDSKTGVSCSVGIVEEKPIATLRKVHKGYIARIEGWQWTVTDDMPISKFNTTPGDKILFTPNKFFSRISTAKKEIEAIWKTLTK